MYQVRVHPKIDLSYHNRYIYIAQHGPLFPIKCYCILLNSAKTTLRVLRFKFLPIVSLKNIQHIIFA